MCNFARDTSKHWWFLRNKKFLIRSRGFCQNGHLSDWAFVKGGFRHLNREQLLFYLDWQPMFYGYKLAARNCTFCSMRKRPREKLLRDDEGWSWPKKCLHIRSKLIYIYIMLTSTNIGWDILDRDKKCSLI